MTKVGIIGAGTMGQGKRMEAFKISLGSQVLPGNIEYSAHVQTYGWQGWARNGAISGTTGQSKRVEALKVRLTPLLWLRFRFRLQRG